MKSDDVMEAVSEMVMEALAFEDPVAIIVLRRDRTDAATERPDSPIENAVQISVGFIPEIEPGESDGLPEAQRVAMKLMRYASDIDPKGLIDAEDKGGKRTRLPGVPEVE